MPDLFFIFFSPSTHCYVRKFLASEPALAASILSSADSKAIHSVHARSLQIHLLRLKKTSMPTVITTISSSTAG